MTATDAQVRIIMREREKGRTQEQAAASANLKSRKTAAKYEGLGQLPSELNQPRRYCTRQNPFEEDWPAMEAKLEDAPVWKPRLCSSGSANSILGVTRRVSCVPSIATSPPGGP